MAGNLDTSVYAYPVFQNSAAGKRPLWNVTDVATYFKVSERTVRDWVFKREIPYRKVGRLVRFDPEALEQWSLLNSEEKSYGH